MKFLLKIFVLLLLAVPSFCQYGNMTVIEASDLPFASEKYNQEKGYIHFEGPGYIGVFVETTKVSKIKISVSAKGDIRYYNFPILRYYCDGESGYKEIKEENIFESYSVNFSVDPGVHFIRVENPLFPNTNYQKRSVYIERVYVSGNSCKYIKNVTEDTILKACDSYIKKARKKTVYLNGKGSFNLMKTTFDFGLLVEDLGNSALLERGKTLFDFIVNEESEIFNNPIENWTSGYVTNGDIYGSDFCGQIEELKLNKVKTDNIRLTYKCENKKEDVKTLFGLLNALSVFKTPVQVYDLQATDSVILSDLIKVCAGVDACRGVVLNGSCPIFDRNNSNIFSVNYLGTENGKAKYQAFPGEYKVNGHLVKVN